MAKVSLLEMISILLEKGEMTIGYRLPELGAEKIEIVKLLELQFEKERKENFHSYIFDQEVACQGVLFLFTIGYLMFDRKVDLSSNEVISNSIFQFDQTKPSSIMSIDLMLRFLPSIIRQIKMLDPEDTLLKYTSSALIKWHYSAINYEFDTTDQLDFSYVKKESYLFQNYVNRIIHFKNKRLAQLPIFKEAIQAEMGIHSEILWYEFSDTI